MQSEDFHLTREILFSIVQYKKKLIRNNIMLEIKYYHHLLDICSTARFAAEIF